MLLRRLVDATSNRTTVPVDVEIDGQLQFADHAKIALYRVAQESLNNVVRHADARRHSISVDGV